MEQMLLRNLKHELRTPVNHIMGYSALVLEEANESCHSGVAERAKCIQEAAKLLTLIIDKNLAGLSEIPNGTRGEAFRAELEPVMRRVVHLSAPSPGSEQEYYASDFERIRTAVMRLMSLSGSLESEPL